MKHHCACKTLYYCQDYHCPIQPLCSVIMAVQQRSYSRSVGVSRPSAQHIHAHALRGTSGVLQQLQSRPGRARACQGLQHATAAPRQQSRVQLQQQQKQQPAWVCRSSLASQATPEPIPDGEGEGQHSTAWVSFLQQSSRPAPTHHHPLPPPAPPPCCRRAAGAQP